MWDIEERSLTILLTRGSNRQTGRVFPTEICFLHQYAKCTTDNLKSPAFHNWVIKKSLFISIDLEFCRVAKKVGGFDTKNSVVEIETRIVLIE